MENNGNSIFRKKSMDKMTSAERLTDYVRVSNPGVGMILAAVIILLAGALLWGIFGGVGDKVSAFVVVSDGNAVCYVREDDVKKVGLGQSVVFGEYKFKVSAIPASPITTPAVIAHIGFVSEEDWVFELILSADHGDLPVSGVYKGTVETEHISSLLSVLK